MTKSIESSLYLSRKEKLLLYIFLYIYIISRLFWALGMGPEWLRYNLPDFALSLFAYDAWLITKYSLSVLKFKFPPIHSIYYPKWYDILVLFSIGPILEVMQYLTDIGTYDVKDVIAFTLGSTTVFIYIKLVVKNFNKKVSDRT